MRTAILSAAISCVSIGFVFAGEDPAVRQDRPAGMDPAAKHDQPAGFERAARQGLPAGVTAKELNDQEDVRSVLAAATNAAVTKRGFDDMIERLSSADRKRLDEFAKGQDTTQIDGRIEQIHQAWQQKYGESFNLNDANLFHGLITVQEGEITDAVELRSGWPMSARSKGYKAGDNQLRNPANDANDPNRVNPNLNNPNRNDPNRVDPNLNDPNRIDSNRNDPIRNDKVLGNSEYLVNGRNVAVVHVAASHSLPAVNVSMIHEPVDDWRIDIADDITGQQLYDNVLTALTKMGEKADAWPADKNEAYRKFAHCLLLAVNNVPMEEAKDASADTR